MIYLFAFVVSLFAYITSFRSSIWVLDTTEKKINAKLLKKLNKKFNSFIRNGNSSSKSLFEFHSIHITKFFEKFTSVNRASKLLFLSLVFTFFALIFSDLFKLLTAIIFPREDSNSQLYYTLTTVVNQLFYLTYIIYQMYIDLKKRLLSILRTISNAISQMIV